MNLDEPRLPTKLVSYTIQAAAISIIAAPYFLWPLDYTGSGFVSHLPTWGQVSARIGMFFLSMTIIGTGANIMAIVIRFGIPMAVSIYSFRATDSTAPIIRFVISSIIWGGAFYLFFWLMSVYTPELKLASFIGLGLPLFIGIGRTGANKTNMVEFLRSNKHVIKPDHMDELIDVCGGLPGEIPEEFRDNAGATL